MHASHVFRPDRESRAGGIAHTRKEMNAWDTHRDILTIPSAVAAFILGSSYFSDWAGVAAIAVAILAFSAVHRVVFGTPAAPRRRRNLIAIALVILGQGFFWGIVYLLTRSLLVH